MHIDLGVAILCMDDCNVVTQQGVANGAATARYNKRMELSRNLAAIHLQKPKSALISGLSYMSFDSITVVCGDFPNPAEQAQAILEASDANIQVARSLVWTRIRLAATVDELHYWCQVDKLLSKPARCFNTNASSAEEAER